MYLCYIDESGTSEIPGNTSHYVLSGLSIPVWHWRNCDRDIEGIKAKYSLANAEIHAGWLLRRYRAQSQILDFVKLNYDKRRYEVGKIRNAELIRLQKSGNSKRYRRTRKTYRKTNSYIHLTYDERKAFAIEVAQCVENWGFARLFAECVDKIHFDPNRSQKSVAEQAFEQVVSRYERYLQNISTENNKCFGLLIHDNNPTVEKKHTDLMRRFLRRGTFWTQISNIIETPLFVDSSLTSIIQIADLASYAFRRYLENGEEDLFDHIFGRADRVSGIAVGVRHFSNPSCNCRICAEHTP
jgi:hypothetical protein